MAVIGRAFDLGQGAGKWSQQNINDCSMYKGWLNDAVCCRASRNAGHRQVLSGPPQARIVLAQAG